MAGVVAMASVIEDFDTQPCKKSRKDGSSPVVKTITNYFSPVPKPVEKPFSPPRSNKIMDYFSRKAPAAKEKPSPPPVLKENCQKPSSQEKRTNAEVGKKPSEKRGRKPSRAARKLVTTEAVDSTDDASCLIVEEAQENKASSSEAAGSRGTLGSDTAALLSKLSAEACESGICKTAEKTERDSSQQRDPKCENSEDLELKPNTAAPSPRAEAKPVKKAARKPTKRLQKESKRPEPEEKEAERSLSDVNMDVSLEETSELNSSTVTISFEDFVRSQSQNKDVKDDQGEEDDGRNTEKTEELKQEQLDVHKEDSVGPLQVSPRILTIQAEVHNVSPKQETVKAVGKFASIFTRKKSSVGPAESAASPPADDGRRLPPTSSTVKRRSNVVLQEEDLELAVIESESTPKCSEAERKQFMAAFKQPSLEGSKGKAVKSKQKQAEEKTVEAAEDGDASAPLVEDGKSSGKKNVKKGRTKAKDKQDASPAASAVKDSEVTIVEAEEKKEEPPITSPAAVPTLRRSKRETVVKKSPESPPTTPARRTRRREESKEGVDAASPQISPEKMSTPKTRRSKHGVFVAEMVCPPDTNESPIRIRLSRVHKNVPSSKTEIGNDITTSNNKMLNESKKRKQAKKLVEKAKIIQQNKKTSEEETLRRSSRTKSSMKKSYCENEDSVICIQDLTTTPQSSPQKTKTQKALRSLNEVLGKAKEPKSIPGSKAPSQGQDKPARKVSAVISIFDDSSREGSENSQDDEHFRARREFLKSGLPESFRKQIAKNAATKEAYSASSSSFQPVLHTTQPPNDCSLWSLPWPESSRLGHLKDHWSQTRNPLPSVSGSLCVKIEPASRNAYEKGSVQRAEISESDRQLLMKEFCSTNPHFPAETVFSRLHKRRASHQQQFTALEAEAVTKGDSGALSPDKTVGGKRKRKEDERENNVKVAKKQKSNHAEENVPPANQEPPRRGGRTSRAQRSRMKEEEDEMKEKAKVKLKSSPIPAEDDSVIVVDDLTLETDSRRKDLVKEELLWTDKYQPQVSADIIDNSPAVKRLYSWLKDWKLRADRDERKSQKDKKREDGSYDSEWDCGEEDHPDAEDALCNTVLITGPTGVGKTAAVYACAQELGFKVFEVNASSQRSGRLILSQLKEATQSHQVDSQGVNAHKPAYFSSYGLSGSSSSSVRPGSSPKKVNSPRRVVSSPRKNPQSPRGAKKGGLAPTSLAKYFKMGQPAKKDAQKPDLMAPPKKAGESSDKSKSPASSTPKDKSSEEPSKKTATSLILFEEVDVIFDDDSGFLAAIKTFMSTTKRPVILTTSDPAFSAMFDGIFEEIHFKKPSAVNVGSYLQLLCLAEDTRTRPSDVNSLLKLNSCDIRQSLLQLQFWARSAGGRPPTVPLVQNETEVKPENKEAAHKSVTPSLPPCDTGCTESKLGLLNIEPDRDIWELLRSRTLMEADVCWELLTDSRRRGVDLLYSNMEKLLPLPLTQLSTSNLSKPERCPSVMQDLPTTSPKHPPSSASMRSDTLPPGVSLLHAAESADFSDSCSPLKVSSRMKRNKKRHHLPSREGLHSDSDSEDGFVSLCDVKTEKERVAPERVKRKPLTAEEQMKSVPVSQCLHSIASFWDDMSYVDSSLHFHPDGLNGYRRSSVGAVIKDGMTDESRIETGRGIWSAGSRAAEIQATVEALSFYECRASVSEAWDKVQQLEGDLRKEAAEELTLPVASHREDLSFTQDELSHPQLAQQRKEVMESLFFKVFGTLGSRQAAALDYLPAIRAICRSEQLKEQGKVKRRFLHYLDAIHLGLEKSTLQFLAEDFP